jgi:multimeric flavodoxin WrbA
MADLTSFALNCTLSADGTSSTELLLGQVLDRLADLGAPGAQERAVRRHISPGVTTEVDDPADEWPELRQRIVDADVFLLGTPIWMGQPSSVCKRVLERLDALTSEVDDADRMPSYGTVAGVVVVGNEDGAHHVAAELFQALNDVGFTIASNANTYWVGEAMTGTDYADLDAIPEAVARTNAMVARNSVHLARLLRAQPYPGETG